jgi:transcriptional regulator with XRE-family HTH domain
MENDFGRLLRTKRTKAGKSMLQVADLLGVSVAYISDVERGRRSPLRADRIEEVAKYLHVDAAELAAAAASSRGVYELPATGVTSKARAVGAALMRGWPTLSEEKLAEIESIIKKDE